MNDQIKLNIGCGADYRTGWVNVDHPRTRLPVDVRVDLDALQWPWADNSVDRVDLIETMEHLSDPDAIMVEIHRILKPGGVVYITVPYCHSDGAFISPEHKHYFHPKSFDHLTGAGGYDAKFGKPLFQAKSVELSVCKVGWKNKMRNAIPDFIRKGLTNFIWNMYDGVEYELIKR